MPRRRTQFNPKSVQELQEVCAFMERCNDHRQEESKRFDVTTEINDGLKDAAKAYLTPKSPIDESFLLDLHDYLLEPERIEYIWSNEERVYRDYAESLFEALVNPNSPIIFCGKVLEAHDFGDEVTFTLPTGEELARNIIDDRYCFLVKLSTDGWPYMLIHLDDGRIVFGDIVLPKREATDD